MNTDYRFYVDSYGGNEISEEAWIRLSQRSERWLKHFTFDRIPDEWNGQEWENQAKSAVCQMAEIIQAEEKRSGKTSENTDGYSVSYDTSITENARLYKVAYVYLGNTGMMDFGDDCE